MIDSRLLKAMFLMKRPLSGTRMRNKGPTLFTTDTLEGHSSFQVHPSGLNPMIKIRTYMILIAYMGCMSLGMGPGQ
jgi:hypothetical protein